MITFQHTTSLAAPDLWPLARDLLQRMHVDLGGPASVAAITKLTRAGRRAILEWLAPLEALVRKLLLVEAAALPRPTRRKLSSLAMIRLQMMRLRRAEKGSAASPLGASPRAWRTAFHTPLPDLRAACGARIRSFDPPRVSDMWRPQTPAPTPPQKPPNSARRLALRFEALCRAIADPAPHARRLARLLWRQPPRAAQAARPIAFARAPRRSWFFNDAAFDAASARAREALAAFVDSS